MTESDIPQLHLSRDHIMAMTQLLTTLSQQLAEQRERRGRAAYSNGEHAARIADTHQHPVVRSMSETEREQFTGQAGHTQTPEYGLTVVTAPVGQEWGVRAMAPTGDQATVMCPNITEAGRLADYLRGQNNPAAVGELNELSEQVGRRVAGEEGAPAVAQPGVDEETQPTVTDAAHTAPPDPRQRPTLTDLVTDLPESLTSTPGWKGTEARFAELTVQGVHPAALAAGVQSLDFDRARRPNALVQWSLQDTALAWATEHHHDTGVNGDAREVTTEWARQLDPTNAVDRASAAEAVGRYGPDIDATLAGTYPGLLTAATDARTRGEWAEGATLAQQQRETTEALTAESTARLLRRDDVANGQGGDEALDREEAAVAQDGEAAEHRGRQSEAGSEVERARDDKVTAQFTSTTTPASTTTAPRRSTNRTSPTAAVPTQTRTRGRGR